MQQFVLKIGNKNKIKVKTVPITTYDQAQNGLFPYGTFYISYNNKIITHETQPKIFFEQLEKQGATLIHKK
jgi:hypothetical protein